MNAPELSRMIKARFLPAEPVTVEANEAERAALATRFGISAVERLVAVVSLEADGETIHASGTLEAEIVQPCAVSGEDFANSVAEPVKLVFVPPRAYPDGEDEKIDLEEADLDEIEFTGESFDLGEAVAQTLGLAIDPYAEGPGAEDARRTSGIEPEGTPRGPLADALKGLAKD